MRSGHPLERIDGGKLRCHRRDVVRRRGDFSGRSFGLPKYRASGPCAPGPCAGQGKLSVAAERIDGGKLRCTGATWSVAVVMFPVEVLAFQNIERQAHALRANASARVWYSPRRHPRCG